MRVRVERERERTEDYDSLMQLATVAELLET